MARLVSSRVETTRSSLSLPLPASGPADLSRSSWSALASWVACCVILVSSFIWSSCWMLSSEPSMRNAPRVVAATTGSVSRETSRVLMRQLRRAMRLPGPLGPELFGLAGCSASPPPLGALIRVALCVPASGP
ncbi:hypothetical protein SANTM175S_02793 [Streptomyces antimycoticus]